MYVVNCVNSDAALFRRAAAVVRHRRDVADDGDVESNRLHRADGGFTTGAGTFDADFNFFQAVSHRLAAGILRNHLCSVSGAFARTFETDFAGARPADHRAILVGNGDDGVIESGEHVSDAAVDVFAALRLDDFDRLDDVRI